ncbi:MAG: S-methyl-5'-thioinosine phosphorylase [Solirubrobacterales bacterium]|nr:S-methyl-5'-thioinosine phosphorylase [Solirubrobacterales bacterium]
MIGGSGLYTLEGTPGYRPTGSRTAETGWGTASGPVRLGAVGGTPVAFLARHGERHSVAPHRVNFRANIEALRLAGVSRILAVGTVGGIDPDCVPGVLVVPDQLIDYTSGRERTFSGPEDPPVHLDFTEPYSPGWRKRVTAALGEQAGSDVPLVTGGIYGVTDGPRFETAAEVQRLKRDGCTIVGMTSMPEAVLAREAGLEYAAVCPVGNVAAGLDPARLDLDEVITVARRALPAVIAALPGLA